MYAKILAASITPAAGHGQYPASVTPRHLPPSAPLPLSSISLHPPHVAAQRAPPRARRLRLSLSTFSILPLLIFEPMLLLRHSKFQRSLLPSLQRCCLRVQSGFSGFEVSSASVESAAMGNASIDLQVVVFGLMSPFAVHNACRSWLNRLTPGMRSRCLGLTIFVALLRPVRIVVPKGLACFI